MGIRNTKVGENMSSSENIEMSLNDEVIGQIAKLVQLAILTGTDVVDNLRMLRVTMGDEGTLVLTDEYRAMAEDQVQKLIDATTPTEEDIESGDF